MVWRSHGHDCLDASWVENKIQLEKSVPLTTTLLYINVNLKFIIERAHNAMFLKRKKHNFFKMHYTKA